MKWNNLTRPKIDKSPLKNVKFGGPQVEHSWIKENFHAKSGVYSTGKIYKNPQVENIQMWGSYNPKDSNGYFVGKFTKDKI